MMAGKTTTESPTTPTVAEATAARDTAQREVGRLRAFASGRGVERWEQQTRHHVFPTASGARGERDVVESVLVTDPVDPLDRLRAQQALPAAEARWLEAEALLEQARRAAAITERTTRERVIAEGTAMIRTELPRLLKEQRRLQRQWQQLQAQCEAVDRQLGHERFAELGWGFAMAAGAVFDTFVAHCRESYDLGIDG